MSQYTTTIRQICNSSYGEGRQNASIRDILNAGRRKIFNFDYDLFDEDYKAVIETKVIRHYFMHEIGQETVNLWLFDFESRWLEIIDYYDQLYRSTLLEFDPLKNSDYKVITKNKSVGKDVFTGNVHTDTSDVTLAGSTTVATGRDWDKTDTHDSHDNRVDVNHTDRHSKDTSQTTEYLDRQTVTEYNSNDTESGSVRTVTNHGVSDTPQGALSDVQNFRYLSKADYSEVTVTPNSHKNSKSGSDTSKELGQTVISNSGVDTDDGDSHTQDKGISDSGTLHVSNTTDNTEVDSESRTTGEVDTDTSDNRDTTNTTDGVSHTEGKTGSESYSDLLQKYRDTFINVDMMIINELRDMFMLIY